MFNLAIVIGFVGCTFSLLWIYATKKGTKIFKINPYLQAVYAFILVFMCMLILPLFIKNSESQQQILALFTLVMTAYVGVVFQKYYFNLSDGFDKKLKANKKK